jgi:FkbM family methyltransferase
LLINRILKVLLYRKIKGHFSQYGEDIVIHKMFPRNKKTGTYVDIGAYHPFKFSNTAYLWLMGWSGVNVDANHKSIKLFKRVRPSDINIFGAVVSSEIAKNHSTVPIYSLGDNIHAMGTCDTATADERGYSKAFDVPTHTINSILEQTPNREIDFLNIDIEGLDQTVLSEIDFNIFLPKVICIEDYANDVSAALISTITTKLVSAGYSMKARVGPSSIFQLNSI